MSIGTKPPAEATEGSIAGARSAPGAAPGSLAPGLGGERRGVGQPALSAGRRPCGPVASPRCFGRPPRTGGAVAAATGSPVAAAHPRAAPLRPSRLRLPLVVVRHPMVSGSERAARATEGSIGSGRHAGAVPAGAPPARARGSSPQFLAQRAPRRSHGYPGEPPTASGRARGPDRGAHSVGARAGSASLAGIC
jgi:hypothetical protein